MNSGEALTMNNFHLEDVVFLTVIAERNIKAELIDSLSAVGGKLLNVEYAHGSADINTLREMFGFYVEKKKVVINCLMRKENAEKVFNILNTEYHFDEPNTGIAFTVALDKLSF